MPPETFALDGLTADVPRTATFTNSTQVSRLFLLFVFVFAVGGLWYLADRDLGNMNTLKAQGRTTLAHVIGKHTTQGKSTGYYLEYDFIVDGNWVYGDESVSEDEYADARSGAAIPVTFLPSRPETYALGTMTQERIQARQSVWFWGEFGAFTFFSLLLLGTESTFRRHLSLLRDGSLAAGEITHCHKSGREGFFISYEFTVEGWLASKKITRNLNSRERVELGSTMAILYDPSRPSRCIPYRMLTGVTLANRGETTSP